MSEKKGKLNQQQWINLMIWVVSALILMFVFLGKMMERNSDASTLDPSAESKPIKLVLSRIDFGQKSLVANNGQWRFSDQAGPTQRAEMVAQQWLQLINGSGKFTENSYVHGDTVIMYFDGTVQPIIAKVIFEETSFKIHFVASKREFVLPEVMKPLYLP